MRKMKHKLRPFESSDAKENNKREKKRTKEENKERNIVQKS